MRPCTYLACTLDEGHEGDHAIDLLEFGTRQQIKIALFKRINHAAKLVEGLIRVSRNVVVRSMQEKDAPAEVIEKVAAAISSCEAEVRAFVETEYLANFSEADLDAIAAWWESEAGRKMTAFAIDMEAKSSWLQAIYVAAITKAAKEGA